MTKKNIEVFNRLKKLYPEAKTALNFSTPWQMLVSTILSAQCTDKRVNIITGKLFSDYPDINDYAGMSREKLENYIRSAGFYRNKAKNILNAARKIIHEHKGRVPGNMEELVKLPGVARKTANVVLANSFNKTEGIAVDTHVKRLSYRLGLTEEKSPEKIEKDLMKKYPRENWTDLTYILIEHGRNICKSRRPLCQKCSLESLCPKKGL